MEIGSEGGESDEETSPRVSHSAAMQSIDNVLDYMSQMGFEYTACSQRAFRLVGTRYSLWAGGVVACCQSWLRKQNCCLAAVTAAAIEMDSAEKRPSSSANNLLVRLVCVPAVLGSTTHNTSELDTLRIKKNTSFKIEKVKDQTM
ncbi:hypothetical protein C0J52_12860 [Blattella germanica]|nr:hypothetical protein C0J52_12860 [Blattella germanica]